MTAEAPSDERPATVPDLSSSPAAPDAPGGPAPAPGASARPSAPSGSIPSPTPPQGPPAERYCRRARVVNPEGLHARPAAEFARLAATAACDVSVNGRNAKSVLMVLSLGLMPGAEAEICAPDPEGRPIVDALADLVAGGFAGPHARPLN